MASLELRDLHKRFPNGLTAVESLSLTVEDGECVALLGPSGCGKTTTLRMIAGLEQITAGEIHIEGRLVNGLAPRDRDLAMVFQEDALYPHMSVRKNLSFGLRMRRVSADQIDQRVSATAELLGITQLLDYPPHWLSGGQRQRVSLGRAMVRNPAAFLLDEPLSHLDARLRMETRAELKRLHRRLCTTTIYVTHDQEEALTLGDRVAVMESGRIQQCAPPLTVYRHPANRFVAEFVGSPKMNFLSGQLTREGNGCSFASQSLRLKLTGMPVDRLTSESRQEVVLGLRPEDIELCSPSPQECDMRLRVELVEVLGSMMDVVLAGPAKVRLIARMAAKDLDEGTEVGVCLRVEHANLFEPGKFGRNLLRAAQS